MGEKTFFHKELSDAVRECFFTIRRTYGPGHKESVYANLLAECLKARGISFIREADLPVYSQETGKRVGTYRPDFVIAGKIIVEVKSSRFSVQQDERQLYFYLRNSEYEVGYLVNFSSPRLFVRRILYTNDRKPFLRKVGELCLAVFFSVSIMCFPKWAAAAQLYLFPDPLEIPKGGTALVEVRLDTEGEAVNAAQIFLTLPPAALSVRDVSLGGSVLPLVPEAPFVGTNSVRIIGGAPSGFQGGGVLARLVLEAPEAPRSTAATLSFDEEQTKVLLNDGKATPARLTTRGTQVLFVTESDIDLTSPSHGDEMKWYANRTAIFHWTVEEGATYSYTLSRDPLAVPDDTPDTPVGDIKFEGLDDGVYYFTLKKVGAEGIAHRRVMIDGTPPEPFEVVVAKDPRIYDGEFWYAAFTPTDALSGIARVEIAEVRKKGEEPQWYEAASPYVLRYQDRSAELRVRVFDNAGNMTETVVAAKRRMPKEVILIGGFLAIVGILFSLQKRRKQVIIGRRRGNPSAGSESGLPFEQARGIP